MIKLLAFGRPLARAPARSVRRRALSVFALAPLLALGGCFGFGGGGDPTPDAFVTARPAAPEANVKTIGDGAVTVAILLPVSAGGSASGLATAFQNAVELALDEVPQDNVRVIVLDTAGESDRAREAAQRAVASGAQLILGPVFAEAVSGTADVARAADVPVVAFSTDATVAGRDTYLLSFLPKQDASRIVRYASSTGVGAFAALVPDNGYGLVMEAAFREAVASARGRVVGVERYAAGEVDGAAGRLAQKGAFEAVFVPGGGDDPAAAARAFSAAGLNVRLLGSGQWGNAAVRSAPSLVGAWYPGPTAEGFASFAERYRAKYGQTPPRTASLVYDATLLANGLVGARGTQAFRSNSLQTADGFVGVDGIFRLTRDGLSERGLAVYEIEAGGGAKVISPAPAKFDRSF